MILNVRMHCSGIKKSIKIRSGASVRVELVEVENKSNPPHVSLNLNVWVNGTKQYVVSCGDVKYSETNIDNVVKSFKGKYYTINNFKSISKHTAIFNIYGNKADERIKNNTRISTLLKSKKFNTTLGVLAFDKIEKSAYRETKKGFIDYVIASFSGALLTGGGMFLYDEEMWSRELALQISKYLDRKVIFYDYDCYPTSSDTRWKFKIFTEQNKK